jgi:translation initiation factor 3 subunit L
MSFSATAEATQVFLTALDVACAEGDVGALATLHSVDFPALSKSLYSESSWPEPDVIAPLLASESATALYRDLYFRHAHTVLEGCGELRISHRFDSWEAFKGLFELAARDASFVVPSAWLFEAVGQFVGQFHRFCEYRNKIGTLSDIEKELINDSPEVWGCYAVIQTLVDVTEASGIRAVLAAAAAEATSDEQPRRELSTQHALGYFALGGIVRLQLLLGDYYSTLEVLDTLFLQETGNFSGIRACHVMLRYQRALAYLLSHRYVESIIAGSALMLDLERQPRGNARSDFVSLKATNAVYILAVAVSQVSVLLFTVTFYANHAHNLTRSP